MRKWRIFFGACLIALIVGAVIASRANGWLANYVRGRTISTLQKTFATQVEFGDLTVSIYPEIVIRGGDLVLRRPGHPEASPLITVKKFQTNVGPWELLRPIRHVRKITLEGLVIAVPPREERPAAPLPPRQKKQPRAFSFVIDEIATDDAELDIRPRDPGKLPRVFHIQHLELHNAGLGHTMFYHATLSNPLPAGEIESRGEFGPWQANDPRLTPLSGTYTFSHADLSSIHGLSGILSSKGEFRGRLDRIDVRGQTDTPNFSLGISGHPVPLATEFHAIVDGATGNTMLDDVRARLLDSEIIARGGVFRDPGQKYRRISLDAVSNHARLEDLLRLALKANEPPMTGDISFQTRIDIPPGEGVIADRLRLDGEFNISSAHFARLNVQQKLASLSRRARGETQDPSPGSVASNFAGAFKLQNGTMTFSNLTFGVPGALVHLDGTYALRGEDVDFRGTLRLQATLSQMTTGWKSAMLRPFDRLFERGGAGTLLPITIRGTGSDPRFGVDLRRVF